MKPALHFSAFQSTYNLCPTFRSNHLCYLWLEYVFVYSVMFQSLLKLHYVYTAWLHKISPTLIVCRIFSINFIRNLRQGFADNRSNNNIYQNQTSRGTNAGANFIQSQHFMSKIVVEKNPKSCNFPLGTSFSWIKVTNVPWEHFRIDLES
jgi:hypothetical protein